MSDAWEVTAGDIFVVFLKRGERITDARCEKLLSLIDHDEVEDHVLYETDFDKQVAAAYAAIENQLINLGVLSAELRD